MTPFPGPVLVVGAGLLGTSVGLALRARGVDVLLTDVVEENLRTASGLGAGRPAPEDAAPQLVVVAVPPDHLATSIVAALTRTDAVVTDVGSVKGAPLAAVAAQVGSTALGRYVGGHPMAGSERSGPLAASAVLFDGRPWAIAPHPASSAEAIALVTALAEACGATPFTFTPEEHDEAVARTSHLPHVVAALVAGRLVEAPQQHLALSGQGVRDVTRIAAGDPRLWEQILTANTSALAALLREVRDELDGVLGALESGSRPALTAILDRGVAGTSVIPGKHGGPAVAETGVFVVVPDHPGELARLFADVGKIGVNVEDVRIDHDPGRPVGLVELTVGTDRAEHLLAALAARGWAGHR
ncbi:MAG TPA: prephenate dehydrogenase [Marmoricola sp.]|nr:prephenate dehydrogenase [Marmoricola sp.]